MATPPIGLGNGTIVDTVTADKYLFGVKTDGTAIATSTATSLTKSRADEVRERRFNGFFSSISLIKLFSWSRFGELGQAILADEAETKELAGATATQVAANKALSVFCNTVRKNLGRMFCDP